MSWPARTICGVLSDMRNAYKTYNFSSILSLIEECQMLANRMEANMDTEMTYEDRRKKLREVREELDILKNELKLTKQIKEIK